MCYIYIDIVNIRRNKLMIKKIISIFLILCISMMIGNPVFADNNTNSTSTETVNITRLSGQTRYGTAKAIAEEYNSGTVDSVVLVPGNSFANALPASVLAYQKNAPILLIDETASKTTEAFDYMTAHLSKSGTVYLVGDTNIIGSDFKVKLNDMGYTNIISISGNDIYQTNILINQQLKVAEGTPVIISTGEDFADALAVSAFAANKGYPIILTNRERITDNAISYIQSLAPNMIYITGGRGIITDKVTIQLQIMVPDAELKRFSGEDRYVTSTKIIDYFSSDSIPKIYIASGLNYPDALAGSVLAAKSGAPIILVDPNSKVPLDYSTNYFIKLQRPEVCIFGGVGVISEQLASNINEQLIKPIPINDNPITIGNYTLSSGVTNDSTLQFTGTFDSSIKSVALKIKGNGQIYYPSSITLENGVVNKKIYLNKGPGYYEIWIGTEATGQYGVLHQYDEKHFEFVKNLDQRKTSYLFPTPFIQSDSSEIIELANDITKGLQTDMEKSKAISQWVTKNILYTNAPVTSSGAGALDTLHYKKGVCGGCSDLNAALHRAVGIRAKIVVGLPNTNLAPWDWDKVSLRSPCHIWNEIFIDNHWIAVDSALGFFSPSKQEFSQNYMKFYEYDEE